MLRWSGCSCFGADRTAKNNVGGTAAEVAKCQAVKELVLLANLTWKPENYWSVAQPEREAIRAVVFLRYEKTVWETVPAEILSEIFRQLIDFALTERAIGPAAVSS